MVAMKKNSEAFVAHHTHLKAGDKAPNFTAKDQNGREHSLSSFLGQKLVIFFYPKDNTPTCTAEACSLRDGYQDLLGEGYAVLGVSADDEKSHTKFVNKHLLPYPLLADVDMKMIKDYDVWGTKQLFGKIYDGIVRTSFVIGADGVISRVIDQVNSKAHAAQILEK
jgi:peroxiredoxin Q/BCP